MAGEHLGPAELAAREDVPLSTVYFWNYTGTGPRYFKAGRLVRYRLSDVLEWEQRRTVKREPVGRAR